MAVHRRPVTIRDLFRYRILEDYAVSPDGQRIALTVTTVEDGDMRYHGAIWLLSKDDGTLRRLTYGEKSDTMPRWRPDGRAIAFRSDRGRGPQVYILDLGGGDPRPITSFASGVSDFAWAPDGKRLVVVSQDEEHTDQRPEARRITRVHYKNDGIGLLPDSRSHLWLIDATGSESPRRLTDATEDDANPAWSPNGRWIAFNRTRPAQGGTAPFMDIWLLNVDTGEEHNLTNGRGPCFCPTWSPDGSQLAFVGHTEPNDIWWGKNFGVWAIPRSGGEPRELTPGFEYTAARVILGNPWRGIAWPRAHWSADGTRIFFLATVRGTCQIHVVDASGGHVRAITHGRHVITDLAVSGESLIYGRMTSTEPADLWHAAESGEDPRRLTDLNRELLDEVALQEARPVCFASHDGQMIDYWLIPPLGYDPNAERSYPLILSIHGGPHAAYGEEFHHGFQTFASAGYFVLYVNPRGSQGYGEAFARQVIGDWGGNDFQDLMTAIDHVLQQERIDPQRLGAWGASYGGFMTTWIAGHTDRFAAIVSVVPVTDLISFHGTSDIGHYFTPFEMGGVQPWEDRERYIRMSPLNYVKNVVTPILLVHHEQDMRCPIAQSEEFYTALKLLGRDVELLRVDNASHGIVPPSRAHAEVIGLEAAHGWFAKHLGPDEPQPLD